MLDKYRSSLASLTPEASALVSGALLRRYPGLPLPSSDLFSVCSDAGLTQADLVCAVASDSSPLAVQALEVVAGIPVTLCPPRTFARSLRPVASTAPASPRAPREASAPRPRTPTRTDPRIIVSVLPNPKRVGSESHARYELYRVGMTVTEAIAAGVRPADIAWDSDPRRKFIALEMPS